MKLLKKLVAAVSAITMVATLFSAVVVNAAGDTVNTNPVVTLSKSAVSGKTNTYDITINVDTTNCEKGAQIFQTTLKLNMPTNVFNNVASIASNFNFDGDDKMIDNMGDPAYVNGVLTMQLAVTSTRKAPNANGGIDLVVIKGVEVSDALAEDFDLTFNSVLMSVGSDSSDCIDYGYNTTATAKIEANELNKVTFEATADTPDPETPTYEDVTQIGDTYTDGESDNSVAFVKTFAATETGAEYNMYAKFDGTEKKYKNTISLPTVADGRIGVGVVIQYGDSTVSVSDLRFEKVVE